MGKDTRAITVDREILLCRIVHSSCPLYISNRGVCNSSRALDSHISLGLWNICSSQDIRCWDGRRGSGGTLLTLYRGA